jgi:hypothetical protein
MPRRSQLFSFYKALLVGISKLAKGANCWQPYTSLSPKAPLMINLGIVILKDIAGSYAYNFTSSSFTP